MIKCNYCNTENKEGSGFCEGCGKPLVEMNNSNAELTSTDGVQERCVEAENFNAGLTVEDKKNVETKALNPIKPTGNGRFVRSDEYVVATLGDGVVNNIMSGEGVKRENAILTNSRLYYVHTRGILNRLKSEETVDVRDITGTKIASYNPYGWLAMSIIIALMGLVSLLNRPGGMGMAYRSVSILYYEQTIFFFVAAVILFIIFMFMKKKYLRIEYAGGCIKFSVKKYGMQNIREFQKAIYAAKDVCYEKKEG